MDNRVWVKDAVMTIRLPEEVDHFVADRLREEAGEILVERNVREVVFDFRKTVKLIIDIQNRSPRIAEHGVHALLLQALNNNL